MLLPVSHRPAQDTSPPSVTIAAVEMALAFPWTQSHGQGLGEQPRDQGWEAGEDRATSQGSRGPKR